MGTKRSKLAISGGSPRVPLSDLDVALLGAGPRVREMFKDRIEAIPLDAIQNLQTRPMTLADTLRTILTGEDLKDLEAALPKLLEKVMRTGSKATTYRIRHVLKQMMDEAGLEYQVPGK